LSRITETVVRQIRVSRAQGAKLREVAKEFSVTEATVSRIASRKIWRHLA
jgi:transposase